MNLKAILRTWSQHELGDLDWDSTTGRLAGSSAGLILRRLEDLHEIGNLIGWGAPPSALTYVLTDPLRKPEEFALVLDSMGVVLPPELAAAYPEPPDFADPYLDALTPAELADLTF